jgi:hypothetical protein
MTADENTFVKDHRDPAPFAIWAGPDEATNTMWIIAHGSREMVLHMLQHVDDLWHLVPYQLQGEACSPEHGCIRVKVWARDEFDETDLTLLCLAHSADLSLPPAVALPPDLQSR